MTAADVQRVVADYASAVAAQKLAVALSVRRSWRRMGAEFDASWAMSRQSVVAAVVEGQAAVAGLAVDYVDAAIDAGYTRKMPAEYRPDVTAWPGVTGGGFQVAEAVEAAPIVAKVAVAGGATTHQALESAGKWLGGVVGTILSDTHRGVEQVAMIGRHSDRYVRGLAGPTNCGRCVILAGRLYRSSVAFERHPRCDCVHIPASESIAGDIMVSPHDYLDSLSDEDLARALGSKANAQAWRDGADPGQLVNAYRKRGDVRKAQLYGGRKYAYTIEGVTRRGQGYKAMHARHGAVKAQDDRRREGQRYRSTQVQRLMPSSIYEIAKDRADAVRLLRTYGWIL